jgi:hypothetical protein
MLAYNGSKRASTLQTGITMKKEMQKKNSSLKAFQLQERMKATRKKVGKEKFGTRAKKARQKKTLLRIIFNGLPQAAIMRRQNKENSYLGTRTLGRIVHTLATKEIAFWVGPRKDGIVQTHTTSPFLLTANYYQLLDDDTTTVYPHKPVHSALLPDRRTWFSTRADELRRLIVGQPFTAVTNAQKLSHPWKTHRQEENRRNTSNNLIASLMLKSSISTTQLLLYPLHSPTLTAGNGTPLRYHDPIQSPNRLSTCV